MWDIAREVTEEWSPERVITNILNNCAAINVGVGLDQFLRSCAGESAQEQGLNVVLPRGINNSLMRENGIRAAFRCAGHSQEKSEDQTPGQRNQRRSTTSQHL